MLKEFKEFIAKGDCLTLAVGLIMGSAFTAIVNSIVSEILTPLIGVVCGGVDMSGVKLTIGSAVFGIGNVLNAIFIFFCTAIVLFFIVKWANAIQNKAKELAEKGKEKVEEEEKPAEPVLSDEAVLLTEIRDMLKTK